MSSLPNFTVVIPAKNEKHGLELLIPKIISLHPNAEIIVVDDGSTDDTREFLLQSGVTVISHPYSKGNGAAIKSGLRKATNEIVVCMDGDGQHQAEDISTLVNVYLKGFDMVVGSRSSSGQANLHRSLANWVYNRFSSWMVGHKIKDLTSGFRVVNRDKFLEFINLMPNKFSYPTTITMSFFRAGYSVGYEPIVVVQREGQTSSHVNVVRDGVRFLIIIFKIGTLFSPLKVFLPISFLLTLSGVSYYLYTYLDDGRFTNMGLLLFTTSILAFLMGLISEQITNLYYKN